MSMLTRIEMILVAIFFAAFIIRLVNKNIFSLKKSSPWLISSILILIFGCFPKLLEYLAKFFGFITVSNFLLFSAIILLFVMQLLFTFLGTRRDENVKLLMQELSILKSKVEEYERQQKNKNSQVK